MMSPKIFVDITLRSDQEIPVWDVMGRVWRGTHSAAARAGVKFAVSFPEYMKNGFGLGKKLRVFFGSLEDANNALSMLQVTDVSEYASISRPVEVDGAEKPYEAYMMHRIPSGISKRNDGKDESRKEIQFKARKRRLSQQAHHPFVRMRSSKGLQFRLVFERVPAHKGQQGDPNGYGLSRKSQVIAVPVF